MAHNLTHVGKFTPKLNEILGSDIPCLNIYCSSGFTEHVGKRHPACLKLIKDIPDIIKSPDYIGQGSRDPDSVEFVKRMRGNVLVAVKLDRDNNYLYVASMYYITDSKVERRLLSGRLKKAFVK